MTDTKIHSLLALKHVPNLGDTSIKKLIQHVGSAEEVLSKKPSQLCKIEGIGLHKVGDLHNPIHQKAAEKELQFIRDQNIGISCYDEPEYPEKLKHCIDGPVVLFSRGNIRLQQQKIISIVGTRNITTYGTQFCEELISHLAPLNPVIVSGFAYGVDICAHNAAIQNNLQTVACMAHGLNQVYPKVHGKYVERIEANGGFFTDYWSSDTFDRKNFLGRNRIIAGLSEATLVIESAEKGGSLVTAQIADSYNREVFAVPGRTTDAYSKGCNHLIKIQKAHVLTHASDLLYTLNWNLEAAEVSSRNVQKQLFVELTSSEKSVYTYLTQEGKKELDAIALSCKIPTHQTATLLLNMEMKGVVRPLPGKLFEAV